MKSRMLVAGAATYEAIGHSVQNRLLVHKKSLQKKVDKAVTSMKRFSDLVPFSGIKSY